MGVPKKISRLGITATLWIIAMNCAYAADVQRNPMRWTNPAIRPTKGLTSAVARTQPGDPRYADAAWTGLLAAVTGMGGKKQAAIRVRVQRSERMRRAGAAQGSAHPDDAVAEELSSECLAADQIAQDWTEILAPYLTGVDPECAKDTAFDIVAVGLAGQHQSAEKANAFREKMLTEVYAATDGE